MLVLLVVVLLLAAVLVEVLVVPPAVVVVVLLVLFLVLVVLFSLPFLWFLFLAAVAALVPAEVVRAGAAAVVDPLVRAMVFNTTLAF